jgi:aquaporin related protein
MQNPLRRPTGNAAPPPRPRDVERNKNDDGGYLAKDVRGHLVAMTGEFVGTFMFLFFAFAATQIANTITPSTAPTLDQLLFISLAFGFSLAVTAWVFYRISGGLFNPAVCTSLFLDDA